MTSKPPSEALSALAQYYGQMPRDDYDLIYSALTNAQLLNAARQNDARQNDESVQYFLKAVREYLDQRVASKKENQHTGDASE